MKLGIQAKPLVQQVADQQIENGDTIFRHLTQNEDNSLVTEAGDTGIKQTKTGNFMTFVMAETEDGRKVALRVGSIKNSAAEAKAQSPAPGETYFIGEVFAVRDYPEGGYMAGQSGGIRVLPAGKTMPSHLAAKCVSALK